jgi:putative methylase
MDRQALERALADVADFSDPSPALEQYPTPDWLAAHLLHVATLQGDLPGTVLDLGAGTGMLALGAALTGRPDRVLGLELDPGALAVARENEARLDPPVEVDWVRADATRPPLAERERAASPAPTVVANPPFGAQDGNQGADRAFLVTASDVAAVSYTVHNGGSREFVEAFAADNGGEVTHAFGAELVLDRRFPFHDAERETVPVEAFRVEW